MKNQALDFEPFDLALSELLQGEEMPAPDFASRVMAQVSQTPQEQKMTSRKVRPRYIATIAACAAVVVLCAPFLRMVFSGMGAMPAQKAADAAPAPTAREDSMVAADAAVPDAAPEIAYNHSADESEKNIGGAAEVRDTEPEAPGAPAESEPPAYYSGWIQEQYAEDLLVVILEEETFQMASDWLREQGYPYEDGYILTAEDVARLNAQFPELELDEADCVLQRA